MKSNFKPLCKSNGWILEQKNHYRKCYKAAKFSLSDARMEYSVVELRNNYYKTGGLFTILMVFLTTLTSNVNPSITNFLFEWYFRATISPVLYLSYFLQLH